MESTLDVCLDYSISAEAELLHLLEMSLRPLLTGAQFESGVIAPRPLNPQSDH